MLYTKRLHLRKFKESDYENLKNIAKETKIQEYVPYLYNQNDNNFKENFEVYLNCDLRNDFYIAIETKDHILIGGFIIVRVTTCILDVSYFISSNYTNNGYCAEALKELLNYFKSSYPNYILAFTIKSDNLASLSIMKTLKIPCIISEKKFSVYKTNRQN